MMRLLLLAMVMGYFFSANAQPGNVTLSTEALKNKIKGGWAGQTIGVTFGGPYEFRFNGTFIGDYQPLKWHDGYLKHTMINDPGLYDDLYIDLTFVDVFEKYGLDAPVDSFANAVARAGYQLWHANQACRYNILRGIRAPQSGHWKHNPHADCIDYQIESDFAGLMSPGMPNTASAISDKIGHIMNYGDGWYGGIYIGAIYALAFTSSDIEYIVKEALKAVPAQSEFYQCINDVIGWYKQYPDNWKQTWFRVQEKWSDDIGCPDGVFAPFNIDAKVNAAYVVIGLLYGKGDFTNTMEITTRCGQDADCNPSSAGGILGTMLGYSNIPAYWKMGLKEAEEIDFKYTTTSLNKVYDVGYRHALMNIEKNGGTVSGDKVTIKTQKPVPVRFEKSFEGLYPVDRIAAGWQVEKSKIAFAFEGTGFVIRGETVDWSNQSTPEVYNAELYIDGKFTAALKLPASLNGRCTDICWKYDLPKGKHQVELKILDLPAGRNFNVRDVIIYADVPVKGVFMHSNKQ